MRRTALSTVILVPLALVAPVRAQNVLDVEQDLGFDEPEAWAMKYFASVTQLSALGSPDDLEPGAVALAFEAGWVPHLSVDERRVGFGGTKVEDLNRTPVFARPRLLVGLPAGFSLEGSYLPPIELDGVEPNLAGLALGKTLWRGRSSRLGGRLFGQYGTFEGDFTCSEDDIAGANPFDCEQPSNDEMTLRSLGLELSVAWTAGAADRLEPYLGLAVTAMDLDFRVDARYNGIVDRTKLITDGETVALTAGLAVESGRRGRWAVELFYAPLDVVRPPAGGTQNDGLFNVRVAYSYRLR